MCTARLGMVEQYIINSSQQNKCKMLYDRCDMEEIFSGENGFCGFQFNYESTRKKKCFP